MKKILIVGDSCVDMYWVGHTSGLSAEAPIPVVKQSQLLVMPGMAGNVQRLLQDLSGVETQLVYGPHLPVKNRLVLEDGTQLARWDVEDWCTPLTAADIAAGHQPDAIIVCDYSKGAISLEALRELRRLAEEGCPIFIDTKGDPFAWLGLPDVTLFPNQLEYAAWRDHYDWMPRVVHKMGAQGMRYLEFGEEKGCIASRAFTVRNVCGAGDSVVAGYAYAKVTGMLDSDALYFAADCAGSFVSSSFSERKIASCIKDHWSKCTSS